MTQPHVVLDRLEEPSLSSLPSPENMSMDPVYDIHSPALILFTSGSTQRPKAVVLSHSNLYQNLKQMDSVLYSHVSSEDRSYSTLPWFHCYGLVCELLFGMMKGSQIMVSGYKDPVVNLQQMASFRPTIVQMVPKMIYGIEKACRESILFRWQGPSSRRRFLFGPHLRFVTVGGAPCLPASLEFLHHAFHIPFYQGYGMTEMSPMVSLSTQGTSDFTTTGPFLPNIQWKVDPQSHELWVKGPNQMLGYLDKMISDTQMLLTFPWSIEDPWYATGDQARVDDRGYLSICGRLQDGYKMANGKFVQPSVTEALLEQRSSFIQQCLLFTTTGVNNELLLYTLSPPSDPHPLISSIQSILHANQVPPSLRPTRLHFLTSPFSVENQCLSLKHEKRRAFILSEWNHQRLPVHASISMT